MPLICDICEKELPLTDSEGLVTIATTEGYVPSLLSNRHKTESETIGITLKEYWNRHVAYNPGVHWMLCSICLEEVKECVRSVTRKKMGGVHDWLKTMPKAKKWWHFWK
jgi:hypothetical protein